MSMQTHVLLSTVHVAEACMPLIDVANYHHQYCLIKQLRCCILDKIHVLRRRCET